MVGKRLYRNPDAIIDKINTSIRKYVESYKGDLSTDEQLIIDKIKEWDVKLDHQIMEIFLSSITDEEFDELLEMSLHSVVDLMTDQAKADGVITPHEERIINFMSKAILEKSSGA